MKKSIIFALVIMLMASTLGVIGQNTVVPATTTPKSSIVFATGPTAAPQASISPGDTAFAMSSPLFWAVSVRNQGPVSGVVFYGFRNNSLGMMANLSLGKARNYNLYAVGVKNLSDAGGYYGIGLSRTVRNAFPFIELGSGFGNGIRPKLMVSMGMFITFHFGIKK